MEVIERIKKDIQIYGATKPCAVFYEIAVANLPWNCEPNFLLICTDYKVLEDNEKLPDNSILSYLGGTLKVLENQNFIRE